MENIGSYLDLIADMYQFDDSPHDLLNQLIGECAESELSEDDLDFIAAAAEIPKFGKDFPITSK